MAVFFNGRQLISPTVESQVFDEAMVSQNVQLGNICAIIGRSVGGEPKTALTFSNPYQAQRALVSGELLEGVLNAFAPSPETPGPYKVVAVRVNPATQSTLTLKDANSNDCIVLTSTDYGLYTNRVKVQVEDGTVSGKKITTSLDNNSVAKDNITRTAFTIDYTGVEASATITISNSTVTLKAPSNASPGHVIDLATYPTISTLVDKINSYEGFVAVLSPDAGNTASLNGLDAATAANCKDTSPYAAKADLQACIDWINGLGESFVTAERAATGVAPPASSDPVTFSFLSGAVDGNIINQDWQDCFDAIAGEDVQWVAPLSSSNAIWAMANAHAISCSSSKSERRAFVGSTTGVSLEQAVSDASSLNSDRCIYCYPGYYGYNSLGALTLYPPYMLTSYLAGSFSGVSPGGSMTNKSVNVVSLESEIRNPVDTDYLISGGVLTLYKDKDGVRVCKAVTTWLKDTRYNRVEISTGIATDYTIRAVRDALSVLIGGKATPILLARAKSIVESTLTQLALPEPNGIGLLAGNTANPPFKAINASITGDVLRVSFSCSPVVPVNYVLISVSINPYSGTIASSI
jgi:hypothetical protein